MLTVAAAVRAPVRAMDIPAAFYIPGTLLKSERLPAGHIHDTYVSEWQAGGARRRYVHQRINEAVFSDVAGLMRNITLVTAHLRCAIAEEHSAEQALETVPAKTGAAWTRDCAGRAWRTYRFIEGAVSYDICPDPERALLTGESFGRFIRRMAAFDAARLSEPIPGFQDIPRRLVQLESAIEADRAKRRRSASAEIGETLKRAPLAGLFAGGLAAGRLPLRVTHADPKINNLLFSKETLRPLCIVDLDTCMQGTALYDFGDMVRTGAAAAAEDEPDAAKMKIDLGLFAALARGFMSGLGSTLTEEERGLLHLAPQVLAWCQAARFLADYLNGDVYYRIRHEEHNLQRTRAQLALLKSMEDDAEAMEQAVRGGACL